MSRPGPHRPISGDPPLADRLHSALLLADGNDKPDTRDLSGLCSPVSPLRPRLPAASSSSSSSGSAPLRPHSLIPTAASAPNARRSHSGELSGSSDGSPTSALPRPANHRSGSGPLIYSGAANTNTATSPAANALPAGNIFPSGKIGKPTMMARSAARSDVLGTGTGNYGHGSIMRAATATATPSVARDTPASGDPSVRRAMFSTDPEEVTRAGNEQYKRRQFAEALWLYDRAVAMCPDNAACRNNRAAALMGLGRLGEAIKECQEAVRLDPNYGRAHQRLASLLLRLGHPESARRHFNLAGQHRDPAELQKLQTVEQHLAKCEDFRNIRDWKSALREADAAIAAGIDSSPLLIVLRAEALLRLHQLEEAESTLSNAPKLEATSTPSSQIRFFGMLLDSYTYVVQAQVEMALGRFDNAVAAAEMAWQIDPRNGEVNVMLNNVKSVAKARTRGNELFKSGNFTDACIAYGEGLKYDPSNSILHCNRAACYSKLGQWERSVDDCNEALRIQPNYTKALIRRADSYTKLECWVESVRDYEILRKKLPGDTEVAEGLFHAQVALKTSRGEEVSNMKFGGEVELITGREQFKAAISLPGVSVVYFMDPLDPQCNKTNKFVDLLCYRCPSLNFLKVNIKESLQVAKDEHVLIFPTFKIYKNGTKVKEMIRPSQQMLEYSVRHYSI